LRLFVRLYLYRFIVPYGLKRLEQEHPSLFFSDKHQNILPMETKSMTIWQSTPQFALFYLIELAIIPTIVSKSKL
jgi:hypothetical protein